MRLLCGIWLVAVLAAGCSGRNSIPGVYICSAQLNNYSAKYDIRGDGTAIFTEPLMYMDIACTWTFRNNTVTITQPGGQSVRFKPEGHDLILLDSTVWIGAQSRFVRIR